MSLPLGSSHAYLVIWEKGALMFNIFPHTVFPPFANDVHALLESWQKLIETGCTHFYPGHGGPFTAEKLMKTYSRVGKRWENRL